MFNLGKIISIKNCKFIEKRRCLPPKYTRSTNIWNMSFPNFVSIPLNLKSQKQLYIINWNMHMNQEKFENNQLKILNSLVRMQYFVKNVPSDLYIDQSIYKISIVAMIWNWNKLNIQLLFLSFAFLFIVIVFKRSLSP